MVAGAEVIQELLRFRSQLLQVVGNNSGKIVVCILLLLPAGNVALDTHDAVLHLVDGFVRGNGQDINGQHQAPGEVGKVGNHTVLDIASILPQKQDPAYLAAHLEVVRPKAHTVRGDAVLEMVAPAHGLPHLEPEMLFFSGPEEVMEYPEAFVAVQGLGPAVQFAEVLAQIRVNPVKEGPGLLNILPGDGNGNVLILNQIVAGGGLLRQNSVVLLPVHVQPVPLFPHEDASLEVRSVETAVVDGDFGGCVCRQAVENSAVKAEHILLVLMGGQGIVDIGKPPCLRKFAIALPDAVPENALDRDRLLHAPGDEKAGPFASVGGGEGFNHACVLLSSPGPLGKYFQIGIPWVPRKGFEI